ncbi:MAG: ABC transporter substrate-binding protein [Gemmatimonadales bacterium]
MSRLSAVLLALLGATACRTQAPALLGSGDPRSVVHPSIVDFVDRELDSLHLASSVKVVRWTASLAGGLRRETEQAMTYAANDRIVAVVGHSGSRESLLAANVYNPAGIPQIVPTGTSRRLSGAGEWTFRMVPNDSVEGAFLADVALDSLKARSVLILFGGDEYGVGLRDGVSAALRRRGITQVDEVRVPDRPCSYRLAIPLHRETALAALARHRPDVVVLALRSNTVSCLMLPISEALPEVQFLSGDGVTLHSAEVQALPRDLRAKLGTVTFWDPSNGDGSNRDFTSRAGSFLGHPPDASDALYYDAYQLLIAATREAGANRQAVRQWLTSLGRTRPPFAGVTGPIRFDTERRALLHLVRPSLEAIP